MAAVKISSVRRKAAQKFWPPQQGHPRPPVPKAPLPEGSWHGAAVSGEFFPRTSCNLSVGAGFSCPPSCQPIPGHCRGRQSGHFLETGSLHPPLAALRRFPRPPGGAEPLPYASPECFRRGGRLCPPAWACTAPLANPCHCQGAPRPRQSVIPCSPIPIFHPIYKNDSFYFWRKYVYTIVYRKCLRAG